MFFAKLLQLTFPFFCLSVAFRFIGKPSKEKAFHALRKEREVEWTNAANAEEAEALKANKVRMSSETYHVLALGLVSVLCARFEEGACYFPWRAKGVTAPQLDVKWTFRVVKNNCWNPVCPRRPARLRIDSCFPLQ